MAEPITSSQCGISTYPHSGHRRYMRAHCAERVASSASRVCRGLPSGAREGLEDWLDDRNPDHRPRRRGEQRFDNDRRQTLERLVEQKHFRPADERDPRRNRSYDDPGRTESRLGVVVRQGCSRARSRTHCFLRQERRFPGGRSAAAPLAGGRAAMIAAVDFDPRGAVIRLPPGDRFGSNRSYCAAPTDGRLRRAKAPPGTKPIPVGSPGLRLRRSDGKRPLQKPM
jgi:hypothetical protein